jgi:O-succinylbenzoic acid--CoA ligase
VTSPAGLRPLAGEPLELYELLRGWVAEPDGPVVVRTSGSTGEPKDVVLSPAALLASARGAHERLGGPGRWLLALPQTYVAGLNVLVRSALVGDSPVLVDGSLAQAARAMTGQRRYTALVPTQLHRLAAAGELSALGGFDAVLVGGAALPAHLAEQAAAAGVRVVQTYGASETCGGCVYDGRPLDGVDVRIAGDGRVQLSGPVLFDGYAGRPEVTAQVLADGWFTTGDVGRLENGRLQVLGRADDVAVSGGVNIALDAVTGALRTVSGVRDAVAVAVPDDEWGARVVAVVVGETDLPALREAVAARLPRTWAPQGLTLVDAVPLLDTGKVDRLALHTLAARA